MTPTPDQPIIQTFAVTGLTCEHCVRAVEAEVGALAGVTSAAVDLVAGGRSTLRVNATNPVPDAQIAEALDEAGDYHLA
jgi:copper chaperone CopZ